MTCFYVSKKMFETFLEKVRIVKWSARIIESVSKCRSVIDFESLFLFKNFEKRSRDGSQKGILLEVLGSLRTILSAESRERKRRKGSGGEDKRKERKRVETSV